jgi:predicted ATPase/DNA-binding CsgD family transcriptional regulator
MTAAISLEPAGNLPAEPNSFIGRERDLADLIRLLGHVRVLTLCGPGGIGKTRLAVRLAARLTDLGEPDLADGAWLSDLADIIDPALVPRRVAATLGIRDEPDRPIAETLADAIRPRRMLLVLDTCEHVIESTAALVQQLVASCPQLRVVVTSREPLRVRGETVWRVPPLALPPASDESDPDLAGHEAIRLFVDRAAAVRPAFALGRENSAAVRRLVRTLDGVPLAIELAAARVRALSIEQIATRIYDRFQLLASGDRTAPPRQRTLRAAVDWSYNLLTSSEQILLRRLSVFAGWNLDMAEQVCADTQIPAAQVLDQLAALIDKSLVALDGEVAGQARYRLPDTIREYATDCLVASGELDAIRLRQVEYMSQLSHSVVETVFKRGDPSWPERVAIYKRCAAELPNFRIALAACLEFGLAEQALQLCSTLRSPWIVNGDVSEGLAWFEKCLALDGQVSAQALARALMMRAELAFEQQDYELAAESARQGLEVCRAEGLPGTAGGQRLLGLISLRSGDQQQALALTESALAAASADGDEWEEGLSLSALALVRARLGSLDAAQQAFEQALELLVDNNRWGYAHTLYGVGSLARARGDHAAAIAHFTEALELFREIDARPEIARSLAGIGWVALASNDLELAGSSLTESIRLSLATGHRLAIARGLEAFAALAVLRCEPRTAVRLHGAARALRTGSSQIRSIQAQARLDELLGSAQLAIGKDEALELLAAGARLTAVEAVTLAIGLARPAGAEHGRPGVQPDQPGAGGLTPRELEIAGLIAKGLSNRAIADELVISPATAARHVANIFTKLGFTSRSQLAAWAAQRDQSS